MSIHGRARTVAVASVAAVSLTALFPTAGGAQAPGGGTISGRVTDGAGVGLAGICVDAEGLDGGGGAETDSQGRYQITDLAADSYVVGFSQCDTPDVRFAPEFYNDKRSPEEADQVRVAAGATVTGIDAALGLAGSISGSVTDPQGQPIPGICVTTDQFGSGALVETDAAGVYRLTGLAPGPQTVLFFDCRNPSVFLAELYDDTATEADADPVTVASGADTPGINAALAVGGSISGVVTGPDGRPLADVCVAAVDTALGDGPGSGSGESGLIELFRSVGSGRTDASGRYRAGGLSTGQYQVGFGDCEEPRFVPEAYDDAIRQADADPVPVTVGADTPGINAQLALNAIRRVAGIDRVGTAIAASRELTADFESFAAGEPLVDTVVIARADAYADALAGGPLAAQLGGPLLLTPSEGLTPAVTAEVRRLGATSAVLLGGPTALSPKVEADLGAAGVTDVRRIAGSDRFATAARIAEEVRGAGEDAFPGGPTTARSMQALAVDGAGADPLAALQEEVDEVFVVKGVDADPTRAFPDAVSASGLASFEGKAILLVQGDAVPEATVAALEGEGIDRITIVGGPAAVSPGVADRLEQIAPVRRLAGADRYGTSAAVAQVSEASGILTPASLVLATGRDFPDALVAGTLAGGSASILLLVDGTDLTRSSASEQYLRANADEIVQLLVLGGPAAVSEQVRQQVQALLPSTCDASARC